MASLHAGKTNDQIRDHMVASVHKVVDYLYAHITPGSPIELSSAGIAAEMDDMTQARVDNRCQELQALGILTRTIKYGRRGPDGKWNVGRYALYDLHKTKDEAHMAVTAWGQRLARGEIRTIEGQRSYDLAHAPKKPMQPKPQPSAETRMDRVYDMADFASTKEAPVKDEPVVIATTEVEEVRAIAGPDAPSPMAALAPLRKADDPTALVEATRQYVNRDSKLASHVAALKATARELGIDIDEAVFTAGIKVARDERLETIALVLPVIDRLERSNERLAAENTELRRKSKSVDSLEYEVRRLRTQLERNVAAKVATSVSAAH